MDAARIAELLQPYTGTALPPHLAGQVKVYLDLLLRWNARVNLTAVREPEQMVTRHFGESFFAARILFPVRPTDRGPESLPHPASTLADIGSGAGFPGIPMKLFAPHIALTLIESHNKKAVFLREVIRTLQLDGAEVFCGRAESWGMTASSVTLRAAEQFERVLPTAAKLVAFNGSLCLMIGARQVAAVREILGERLAWQQPVPAPHSAERVVLVGSRK